MSELNINTENFKGTIDLLLKLIKDKVLEVLTLDLKAVINQYWNFIIEQQALEIDQISEYLSPAACLLELQSKALIPNIAAKIKDDEHTLKVDQQKLINRIIEYKKIKDISHYFHQQAKQRQLLYSKNISDIKHYVPPEKIILQKSKIEHLRDAMLNLWKNIKVADKTTANLKLNLISAHDRAQEIVDLLKTDCNKSFSLTTLFTEKPITLHYFVVTFIAILDLAKNQMINLIQSDPFGDIMIKYKDKGINYE